MAITIVSTPDKFTPAFNPVVFSLTSTNYAQPNFKYVADVYSGTGSLLASLKYQPQVIGTDPVVIDVSRVLYELVSSEYLQLNSTQSPNIIIPSGPAISDYSVQFGEQYDNVIYANLSSYSGYIYNAGINNLRFAFYNSALFLNKKFLTQFTRQTVRKRDSAMISMLQSDTTAITGFVLTIYNGAGTNIFNTTISNPYTSLSDRTNRLLHLNIGFDYLYARLAFSAAVYNTAAYYTIQTAGGIAFRMDLYSRCERFPGKRLHFLNELGGFDSFNFMLDTKRKQTVERKSYERQAANIKTAYNSTTHKFEAVTRNFDTKYTEKLSVTSDFLYDYESQLLSELMSSSLSYVEDDAVQYGGTGTVLIPANVTTLEYEIKKTSVDKLFTAEIDIELTTGNYRQVV